MTDGWPPVMLLVTVDDESRAVLDGELRRRYGSDYESAAPVFRAIAEGHAEFQLICSAAPPTVSHRTAACSGRRRPTGTRQASPSWAGWADHLLSCLIVPGRRTRARSMSAVRLVAR